ncbi:thioredoxin domain-containing protein [Streptomyces sp. VRA16 Mangrove soil]|uniref:DsbA family protein n=1 Tax=Streptomyces sp. VRA16 Mangrove soil TaxID=2817434 RepID=UPI001A9E1061|nr:thioredoxin domain-containing protein [Streptomyces sp. VRA16 Mangrove soil]MBO1337430.1 thioredoxin domain-containing protein [Streptomyces sp. VRA16 Mangrove soil]
MSDFGFRVRSGSGSGPGFGSGSVFVRRRPRGGRGAAALAAAALLAAVATACSSGDDGGSGSSSASAAAATVAAVPSADAAALGELTARVEGARIVLGDADAAHTVKVYEDPRCPYCKKFEQGGARALTPLVADGTVKVEYTLASFLDGNLGGSGSVTAVNALRASVEAGRFPHYHAAVYANQPADESTDAYTPDFLLKIAGTVDGLRGDTFDKAVRDTSYQSFVDAAMTAFKDDGVQSTPTVYIDGKEAGGGEGALYDEAQFKAVLKDAGIS